jgi:flagellar motility protein MotE (MotC chaperone)
MHQSIATIDSPEFINLQPLDLNPLMSSCEIKVFYLGENRNHSYINKETATDMAKTLRGAPIVGYFKKDKDDFADHGNRVIMDDEGIKFECMTRPYGFVAPDAKVWFQKFEDTDDFGNKITREYLMTTGFLWTGQFPECQSAVEGQGKPQSMELDENTLDGNWTTNSKSGMEFFIINDAIFSKLCILGEDVEPCFEGASVAAPNVSTTFTKMDDEFRTTLYSMMQDLKSLNFALQGGSQMEVTENATIEQEAVEAPVEVAENPVVDPVPASTEGTEFKKTEDDEKKEEEPKTEEKEEDKTSEEEPEEKADDEDNKKEKEEDDEKKKKYALLEENYQKLEADYKALETKYTALVDFKNKVEDAEKDKMIESFYMLSEEDKADVITNKSKYTLDEIESKLSVICVRKKVNFDLDNTAENNNIREDKPIINFNFDSNGDASVPAWVKACQSTQQNRK